MNNIMTYKSYSAIMTYDQDDKILVGRVVNIDDIIAFHGRSVEEFETAFHESIDDYIEACGKLDQKPEKPASGRLMLRIPPTVHAAAVKAAAHEGQSLNKWVAKVLAEAATHR